MRRVALSFVLAALTAAACASSDERGGFDEAPTTGPSPDAAPPPPLVNPDAAPPPTDGGFETCASVAVEAAREKLPVDIIWVVDNSSSMQPAVAEVQAGLNDFATLIGSKGLDYKVIMLSMRGTEPVSGRYPMCIPPPLGGADCGNAVRFFHAPLGVLSTQPLEQLLGTLDQTTGYRATDSRGTVPWAQELRPNATKSIVLVTDDNSRFPAISFETFPGGDNPNTGGLVLPPGILDPSRAGAWSGYVFNAIYGWGGADPSLRCTYPGGARPSASGAEYTTLVTKTGGARAQICDGSAAWGPFFDAVAAAVEVNARVACEVAIPPPDGGVLDPKAVNVRVDDGTNAPITLGNVADQASCQGGEGWYYDAPTGPQKVILCPASCSAIQSAGAAKPPRVDVLFGCATVVR